jgi:hypothetical protein
MDPRALPASFLMESAKDPANAWPGAPPNFGEPVVPHIMTVSGRIGTKAYQWADEALRDSRVNADKMETDCGIMECVEARQRSQCLLNWHIQAEDDQSMEQRQLADEMTRIIRRTPEFLQIRWQASKCIWYGRSGVAMQYKKDYVGSHMRTIVKHSEPRHGDKFVFRWDDGSHEYDPQQVGIRITAGYHEIPNSKFIDAAGQERNLIEATQYGLVRWFTPEERKLLILDKHIIEDGPFDDPVRAGAIHGVGIRDRIYWTWYGMIECLADVLSYLERSAFGVEIWTYPAGNEQARLRTEAAAKKQTSGGRSVLIVPKERGENSEDFGVQQIEPGLGGIESAMSLVKEYFGHKIKRYILGQTLTSEAAGTGLGSGVADAHMATFADIVKFDAVGREETLTRDFLRPLQLWNFPKSRGIYLRFVIDTESPDSDGKMQGYQAAWNMGAGLKEEEVLSIIGASMPKATDRVLRNPALQQQPMQIPGSGIQGAGGQAKETEQSSIQDLFGPLAAEGGQREPPGGDGGEPPPNPSKGGGPAQYALTDDVEVERYAGRRQVRSSPGQQPLPGAGDANSKQHHLWREELHPRESHGQFADKPGSKALPHQFGQGMLFSEMASKLHAAELEPDAKKSAATKQQLLSLVASSDLHPEQVAALLSGDAVRMMELKQKALETGQHEPVKGMDSQEPEQSRGGFDWKKNDAGKWAWFKGDKQHTGAYPNQGDSSDAFSAHGLTDEPPPSTDEPTLADHPEFARLNAVYGDMSKGEIQGKLTDMTGEIASLQKLAKREFTGRGTRRSGPAVAAEGARNVGQEKLLLSAYLDHKFGDDSSEMPSPAIPEQSAPSAGMPGGLHPADDGDGFELQRSKVREGSQPTKTPDTGGRQEAFFHRLNDAPGQEKLFEGLDLAGTPDHPPPPVADSKRPPAPKFEFDRGHKRHKNVADFVQQAIDDLKSKGVGLPNKIQVQKLGNGAAAWFDDNDYDIGPRVTIDPTHKHWKNAVESGKQQREKNFLSTDHPAHAVYHEVGHAAHKMGGADFDNLRNHRFYGPVKKAIEKEVSRYATTNGAEFIAETFAGLVNGKKYSDTVMNQYRFLNGPPVESKE